MRGTILLVEDERDTRDMLGRALDRARYRTLPAESAAEALDQARAPGVIDVVVTDVVLGTDDLGGLGLIGRLREVGIRAPIIVITAYADVGKLKMALNEGAAYLLEKPFRAPELIDAIERVRGHDGGTPRAIEQVFAAAHLTDKERTVARHLLNGLTSTEIADLERNSPKTIRQHVSQIYAKCGVGNRGEFFRLAYLRS